MQRCGYCDRQSDIDHSEDEKEDHGSAQPAPPTKSRFHRLPPISTSRGQSLVAAMPAVMGEGLKPLTTSQTPRENSHSAIGSAASAARGSCIPIRPKSTAMSAATSRAAPMNPSREPSN